MTGTAIVLAMPRPQAAVSYDIATAPTQEQYAAFEQLFMHFNRELFEDTLPEVMLTFCRKANAKGFFIGDHWQNDDAGETVGEIALNPDCLSRPKIEVVSTLVHEIVHLWQHVHGAQKSRRTYHNAEWAAKMEAVGLMPSSTGEPGGKKTGQRMTHYVIESGAFERMFRMMPDEWYLPLIAAAPEPKKPRAKSSKTKFACPSCGMSAWGKPDLRIDCHACDELMVATT